MTSRIIHLKPVVTSEAQVGEARLRLEQTLKGFHWITLLYLASGLLGAGLIVETGDWTKGVVPLLLGLTFLGSSWRLFGLRRHFRGFETRYAVTEKGLRVANVFHGPPMRSASTIDWNDFVSAGLQDDALVLKTRSAGEIRLPNSCFLHPEDRDELMRRVASKG